MGKALKVCSTPDCYMLVEHGRCPTCRGEAERERGTRQARGYGRSHDRLRRRLKPAVEQGITTCARCGSPIQPGDEWALDHNDDRTGYLGPSHRACNDRAGGVASHAQ